MGKFAAFVVGGLVGAGIMAAVAPRTGKETRQQVVETFNGVKDQAMTANSQGGVAQVATEFAAKGKDIADNIVAGGQETVANASARVQDVAAGISGSAEADELKQKIEEARARIADQVMKNAEESRDAVDGAVVTEAEEAVVEAVEDAEPETTVEAEAAAPESAE